jgi:hypothetical protein
MSLVAQILHACGVHLGSTGALRRLEVAASAAGTKRNRQRYRSRSLLVYNGSAIERSSSELVVTHYDAFFRNPSREVRRLAVALSLNPTNVQLEDAVVAVNATLRHHRIDDNAGDELPRAVRQR